MQRLKETKTTTSMRMSMHVMHFVSEMMRALLFPEHVSDCALEKFLYIVRSAVVDHDHVGRKSKLLNIRNTLGCSVSMEY